MSQNRKKYPPQNPPPPAVENDPPPPASPEPSLIAPIECGSCRHWKAEPDAQYREAEGLVVKGFGFCRRYPPGSASLRLTSHGPLASFPVTRSSEVCGEHAPRG